MKFLQNIFTLPMFPDENQTYRARLLHPILLCILSGNLLFLPLVLLFAPKIATRFLTLSLPLMILCVGLVVLLKKKYVSLSSAILIGILWSGFTLLAITGAGVRAPSFVGGHLVVIFMTGLLLGERAGLAVTVVSMLTGLGLALVETQAILVPDFTSLPPMGAFFIVGAFFWIVTTMQVFSGRIIREVTRRAQTSQDRYQTFLENIPVITYMTGHEDSSPMLYISPQVANQFGYTPQEFLSDPEFWKKIIYPDDYERVWAEHQQTNQSGKPFRLDYRMVTKHGNVVWGHDEAVLIYDSDNRPLHWLGIWTEITERKAIEENLRQSETRLKTITENAPDIILQLDRDGKIIYVNRPVPNFRMEDVMGSDFTQWVPDEYKSVLKNALQEVLTERKPCEYETIGRDSYGQLNWYTSRMAPIVVGNQAESAILITNDITSRKRAEANLQSRDRILEVITFAAEQFLKGSDWQTHINLILEQLGKALNASHAYIFEHHPGPDGQEVASMTFEWADPGQMVEKDNPLFQNTSLLEEGFERSYELLSQGNPLVVGVSTYTPAEAAFLQERGIKALLEVPIFIGEEWWGTIGFDDYEQEREWLTAEIDALKVAANLLSTTIQRQRMDTALRDSEDRFRTIAEAAPIPIIINRRGTGICLYANPATSQMSGVPLSEQIGQRAVDFYADPGEHLRLMETLQQHGQVFSQEIHLRRKDGSLFWALISCVPIIFEGEPCILTILYEITRRKEIEERERQMTHYLRAVVEATDELIATPDLDAFYRRAVELSREKLMLERTALFLLDETKTNLTGTYGTNSQGQTTNEHSFTIPAGRHLENFLQGSQSWYLMEQENSFWDGEKKQRIGYGWRVLTIIRIGDEPIGTFSNDAMITGAPLDEVKQEALAIYCSLLGNILERKHAEQALQDSLNLLTNVINATPDMVFVKDTELRTILCNENFANALGKSLDEIYGHTDVENGWDPELVFGNPERGIRGFQADDLEALSGKVVVNPREPVNIEKEIRIFDTRKLPLYDTTGQIFGLLGVARDVTERIRTEEQIRRLNVQLEERVQARTAELEAANRELEAFSYSVSHDLRAPLRAVNGFSAMLLTDYKHRLPDEGQHYLQRVHDGSKRLGQLVDDLLAFSRLGRQELKKRLVYPAEIVNRVLEEVREQFPAHLPEVILNSLPPCQADSALLHQVYSNLLNNAFKFTHKHLNARIEVGYIFKEGQIIYYVRDNGAGFDEAYIHKLFGVFQRLHHQDEYEGTGIGLANVKRIITRHGGRVWAESTPNEGATFFFSLSQ